ncbi:phosphoglycerate mutase-like protein [Cantharellus anzutake]|uniref:phosphoglycerate mutase-like protein n=1 Tax=Cantharellus anzutake TaxID=1750568 RepID=UPI00190745FB|nr:phosphoglycerate mutase-like protein [Cantharellus anzutake]KAF8327226.1 phosphoglycerate mutase-like protein [Cantharellus anzutake]
MLESKCYDAPRNLVLEQVHFYVRHGERTPVGARMTGPPANIPSVWPFCNIARQFKASVIGTRGTLESLEVLRVTEKKDGKSNDGECLYGELTDEGRRSSLKFGHAIRDIYVKKLGFLPDSIDANSGVAYFRSTYFPRTVETTQQIIHGLWPTNMFLNNSVPRIRMRHPSDENLMGNWAACPRYKELMASFEKAAADRWAPELEKLDNKISKYINGKPVRIDGRPRASGLLDTVRCAKAHGVTIPPEFEEPEVIDTIEKAVVAEWFDGYKDEEVRRLAQGRLLSELVVRLRNKAFNGDHDPLKLTLHGCHDTSLAGMAQTLDVFDGRQGDGLFSICEFVLTHSRSWPDFTAYISVELFRTPVPAPTGLSQKWISPPKPTHYVRLRYQNRSLRLPACSPVGNHLPGSPELCTLESFSRRVAELTPNDWDAECRSTSKVGAAKEIKGQGPSRSPG